MSVKDRVKRVVKEALGRPQSAKISAVKPTNFEEQIYSALVQKADVCYDIGAHDGGVALYIARLAGPTGMVIAFEPILSVYFKLCSRVQQREFQRADIVPIPAGLSERVETTSISVPGNSFGYASLVEQPAWKELLEGARLSAFECDFLTLDVVLSTRKYPKPDFIKIDVEGAELNVLRGGAEAFKNGLRPLMLIELFAPWQKPFGYGPKDVFSYLSKWGYHFLFACPEGLIQHSSVFSDFPPEYENGYNVLAFVPSTHANRIRRLDSLMRGAGNVILPMTPPPIPNRQ